MSKPIHVRIMLFAMLAEAAAQREVDLPLPAGATVAMALEQLTQIVPALQDFPPDHLFFAVNRSYVTIDTVLRDGDELALIPPVSGGAPVPTAPAAALEAASPGGRFRVTTAPLQPDNAVQSLGGGPQMGGLCTFTGMVRGVTGSRATSHLIYEAYPAMAVAEMERIAVDAARAWPDVIMAMHHRIGRLAVGEAAVVIAAAAPHRDTAFQACRFGIDQVKRRCPIWKKEYYSDGQVEWAAPDTAPAGDTAPAADAAPGPAPAVDAGLGAAPDTGSASATTIPPAAPR